MTSIMHGFVAMISTKFIRFSFDKLARTHKIARSFSPRVLVPKPVLTGSAYVTHTHHRNPISGPTLSPYLIHASGANIITQLHAYITATVLKSSNSS